MKFRADRQDFADAVGWANRTLGGRVTLPALAGILLEAKDGRLTCRATDLEVAAEVSFPVQIDEPGVALLPGRLLSQLVGRLPDAAIDVSGDSDQITLSCGRATFHVRGMPAQDFPALPQPDPDVATGVLRADAFARIVDQVARAASTDEARPVLTGVQLEAADGVLSASATDSYRLAVRTVAFETPIDGTALVPARALQEAARAAGSVGGTVEVILEDNQVTFRLGDRRLTTRLIEGTFPNVRQLLPETHETTVVIERAPLLEALQRVAVVAQGKANSPVTMSFEDGSANLAASNTELGDATESLPAEITGEGLTIAFNPAFLQAGLEATGTENIRIELRDGLKPAVLRPQATDDETSSDDFTYLLMPMRTS